MVLLDRVQKRQRIAPDEARRLKAEKLIEGRSPNYFVSAEVADWTAQKARYIRNRALDDDYYRRLIVEYLQKYGQATRKDLDELLVPKLSEALGEPQKLNKVRNLIQSLRRDKKIRNAGSRGTPVWVLAESGAIKPWLHRIRQKKG